MIRKLAPYTRGYRIWIVLGVLCAVWRALAKKRRDYLEKEAHSILAVDRQKEADGEQ